MVRCLGFRRVALATAFFVGGVVGTPTETVGASAAVDGLNAPNAPFAGAVEVVAHDDVVSVRQDGFADFDVRLNDTATVGALDLPFVLVPPAHGTATVLVSGVIHYVPVAGYFGVDVVRYGVCSTTNPLVCGSADLNVNVAEQLFISGDALFPPTFQASAEPARLLDSRLNGQTVDGLYAGIGRRPAGTTTELQVVGRGEVSARASAAMLNVTVADATGPGFITVFACGTSLPLSSNVNYTTGQTIANAVIAVVGADGNVCVYTSNAVDLIIDVSGIFVADSTFAVMTPERLLDSRPDGLTVDGADAQIGYRRPASITPVHAAGRPGIPLDASAVVLNVTVVDALGAGYVNVFPCGSSVPLSSNVNYSTGRTVANLVVAQVGADGQVCIYTSSSADLIVDVNAYFAKPSNLSSYSAVTPARVMDTRVGGVTVDGLYKNLGRLIAGATVNLTIGGRGGLPTYPQSIVLNVTAVNAREPGFVSVWPCGSPTPGTSNLNYSPGETVANSVTVDVGTSGTVCIFTSGVTDLVVDVSGFYEYVLFTTGLIPI